VNVTYNVSVYQVIGTVHASASCHLHSRRFTGGYAGSFDPIWRVFPPDLVQSYSGICT